MKAVSSPLKELLARDREVIVRDWLTGTLETYPEETFRFLLNDKDRFRNPVGQTLKEGLTVLFDELLSGTNTARAEAALDGIIRIRAVQDFGAAQAVSFIFLLKRIIRERVQELEELVDLERRIDEIALLAFDLFMKCREKIYEIKVDEVRRKFYPRLRPK